MYKRLWVVSASLAAGVLAAVLYIHLADTLQVGVDGSRAASAMPVRADAAIVEFFDGSASDGALSAHHDAQLQYVETDDRDAEVLSPPPPMLNPVALSGFPATEYEDMLIEQPVDPHWAPRMESRIYEFIAEAELPISALQAHCRTSICRVEILLDVARARNSTPEIATKFAEALHNSYTGGGWRVNASSAGVYGSRQAQHMPGLGSPRGDLQSIIGYLRPFQPSRMSPEEEDEVLQALLQAMSPEQQQDFLERRARSIEAFNEAEASRSSFGGR